MEKDSPELKKKVFLNNIASSSIATFMLAKHKNFFFFFTALSVTSAIILSPLAYRDCKSFSSKAPSIVEQEEGQRHFEIERALLGKKENSNNS